MQQLDEDASNYEQQAPGHLRRLRLAIDSERSTTKPPITVYVGIAAVAAAALLLILSPVVLDGTLPSGAGDPSGHVPAAAASRNASSEDMRRYKGEFGVQISVIRAGTVRPYGAHSQLKQGDALEFKVQVGQPGYLAIFAIDADGVVSHYYPELESELSGPAALRHAGEHVLPGAIVLDHVAARECWVVAYSDLSFDPHELAKQLRTAPWIEDPEVAPPDKVGSVALHLLFLGGQQ